MLNKIGQAQSRKVKVGKILGMVKEIIHKLKNFLNQIMCLNSK